MVIVDKQTIVTYSYPKRNPKRDWSESSRFSIIFKVLGDSLQDKRQIVL